MCMKDIKSKCNIISGLAKKNDTIFMNLKR